MTETIVGTFLGMCLFVAAVWLVMQMQGWRDR